MIPAVTHAVVLRPGEHLSDQAVSSPNGQYSLVHQHDGNVVVYRNADGQAIWATGTNFQRDLDLAFREVRTLTGRLELRRDGELSVVNHVGEALWVAPARHQPQATLLLDDFGQVTLLGADGRATWSTDRPALFWTGWHAVADGHRLRRGENLRGQSLTSDNGAYTLMCDHGGTVNLRRRGGEVLWVARMPPGCGITLTWDGDVRLRYPDGTTRRGGWNGTPDDLGAFALYVDDDGRLTGVDEADVVIWAGPAPQDASPSAWDAAPEPPEIEDEPEISLSGYEPHQTFVIRTDFSNTDAWSRILREMAESTPESLASLDPQDQVPELFVIDDPVWEGASWGDILRALPAQEDAPEALFVADSEAIHGEKHQLLAIDVPVEHSEDDWVPDDHDQPDQGRIAPSRVWEMTANLFAGAMDFNEFIP